MEKFKGYKVVEKYPEDGYLKGYFYVLEDDIKKNKTKPKGSYQDIGFIKHKDFILHLLNVKNGEKILDVGCAAGSMMVYCGLLGAEVYGIDISMESIKEANKYLNKYTLKGRAIVGDARKMDFPENYFDKAISSDFFEHMATEDNIEVLKEMKRVLKPNGTIIIKTPNLTYLRFSKFFKMIKRAMQLKNPFNIIIPHTTGDDKEHIGLLTEYGMLKIIKSAGFLNFKFYYDINYKFERISYSLGNLLRDSPFLRSIFSEDLIVVIRKPIVLSLFP